MFLLMTPGSIRPMDSTNGRRFFGQMEGKGAYPTLDEAIEAALRADLDLDSAIIEKNGGRHTVNNWIACRIAGGLCAAG